MAQQPNDDVIRIRIDTAQAVDAFQRLLRQQADEGETCAPANPAATAIWRELAPFRLVEYAYIDPSAPLTDGAYIGFPNGEIYAVEEDIPDLPVTALISASAGTLAALPPLYVYIPLRQATAVAEIETFLTVLSTHLGREISALLPGDEGQMELRVFEGAARHEGNVAPDPALSRRDVLEGFAARISRPDGRAYAALTLAFARHVLEFPDTSARDGFIAWTRALCDRIFAQGEDADGQGFAGAYRPAEIAPAPAGTEGVVRLGFALPPTDAPLETMRSTWNAIRAAIETASPPRPPV